ncbi:MAG: hypothetical protein WCA84_20755 [Ignavibacteriaceae bacterium]
MKRYVFYLWFSTLVFLSVFISCSDTSTNLTEDSGTNSTMNIPVTGDVQNSFSFTVNAHSFDYSQTQGIQINANTLSIGITVTNFVSGSGKIIIEDGNGATVYEKDINGAMVSGSVLQLTAVPKIVYLNLNSFTGEVVIGLSGK